MAKSNNENLFTLWETVRSILNVKDEDNCAITHADILKNEFDVSEVTSKIKKIDLYATFTAKREDQRGILNELLSIANKVGGSIPTYMVSLGYTVESHDIDEQSIADQYKEFKPSSEFDFSARIMTLNLTEPAFKKALAFCNTLNKQSKQHPIYHPEAEFKTDDESMTLDLVGLTLGNSSWYATRLGHEYIESDYFKLAMGLAPDFSNVNFNCALEQCFARKVIYTNIEAKVILGDNTELKMIIDCSSNIGGIKVLDSEGKTGYNILSEASLSASFFKLSTSKMESYLSKRLVQGAKITAFTVSKFPHKLKLSNNARYKEIHLFVNNPLERHKPINPMRIVINKNGEIQAYTNSGIPHPNALAITEHYQQFIKAEVVKDLFKHNRRFAYFTLKQLLNLDLKCNRVLFV